MSRTHRNQNPINVEWQRDSGRRPEHQIERGERHGNNRKWISDQKVRERRGQRAKTKDETHQQLNEYQE